MAIRMALAVLPLMLAASHATAAGPSSIEQLAWLSGCWQQDGQPAGAGEQWSTLAGGTLFGSSRSLRDGHTVGFEFMSLRQDDDGRLLFTALPNGRDATDFIATRVDDEGAVFENPANDFPQRIHYRRLDDQRLHARIEGARDNPTQAMDFPMHRVACGGPAPSAPSAPPRSLNGELQGAPWRLDVPDHWNGELVMLAHGYEPVGVPRASPMAAADSTQALLDAGYAVAQSAYSSQGWAVADAVTDMERLRQHATTELKQVRRTWMLGFSMGGAVTVASLEQHPQHYSGGVSLCGANLPGETLANDLLTTLVAFDYFFPKAEGLPADGLLSPEAGALPQMALYQGIAAALATNPEAAAQLATRLQVAPDALAGAISLHAMILHELATRAGGLPVGNVGKLYSGFGNDAAFNVGVRRVKATPAAQEYVRTKLALSGALRRPLVVQYNQDDPSIVPHMQAVYPQLVARAKATAQLRTLPPAGEGHCGFTPAQVVDAVKAAAPQ